MSEDASAATADTTQELDETAKPEDALGDAGKRALTAEREARAAEKARADELAAKLKEIEDRDKSEAEKAAERLAEAEKRAAEVEARATRAEIAATTAVPVDILAGPESSSEEDLRAFAEKVIAFKGEQPQQKLHIPQLGKSPRVKAETTADVFNDFRSQFIKD